MTRADRGARALCMSSSRSESMTLEAIRYNGGRLEVLNQLLLPAQSVYERVTSVEEAWETIRTMKVGYKPCKLDLCMPMKSLSSLDVQPTN